MSCNTTNIKSGPVNVYWELEEQTHVECVADVASSLNNKYFFIYDGTNKKFHVWFNVATAGADPAPAGSTPIVVAIAADAAATAVASAVQSAIDAKTEFMASVSGKEVTITNAVVGEADDVANGGGGASPNFVITKCQDGGFLDMGLIDGDVELTGFKPDVQEITSHQTGATPVTSIVKGVKPELKLTLLEATDDRKKQLFASVGGEYISANDIKSFGIGTAKVGSAATQFTRRLRLHPVALDQSDKSQDVVFWKAYLLPDSILFSSDNPNSLGCSFSFYPDLEKPLEINIVNFGDWSDLAPVVAE